MPPSPPPGRLPLALIVLLLAALPAVGSWTAEPGWDALVALSPFLAAAIWFAVARRSWRGLGFPPRTSGAPGWPVGLLVLLVAVVFAVASTLVRLAVGLDAVVGIPLPGGAVAAALPGLLLAALATAVPEEFVYRGVFLRLAAERWGAAPAVLVGAVLFGAGHLPTLLGQELAPSRIAVRLVALGVLGALLSVATLRTGSLWFALGWHAGSNAVALAASALFGVDYARLDPGAEALGLLAEAVVVLLLVRVLLSFRARGSSAAAP